MKQALIVVSFGTSVHTAQKSIIAVEEALHNTAPTLDFFRAFTSKTIRQKLKGEGQQVLSFEEVLTKLQCEHYTHIWVLPTHLLYGVEYDKLVKTVGQFQKEFTSLLLGKPLIADHQALCSLANAMIDNHSKQDESLILLGHGSDHFANMVYPALQTACRLVSTAEVLVGTIEGFPSFDDVARQLQNTVNQKITLVPFMLVSGDHAINDMAGKDADSWKSRLEALGYEVSTHLKGLGELPSVQALYCTHLKELLGN